MNARKHDVEKQRYWQRTIGDAARSGMSIREFCRQRRLKEGQFYWWQRKLKARRQERNGPTSSGGPASFALVSEDGAMPAGLELVLRDGRRLRISQGVQEETLRAVLAAMEPEDK
ncbi:MAG: IS66 family insertion sequence element accessory protein TnpA [Candidatus Acidiferrales bacterium]